MAPEPSSSSVLADQRFQGLAALLLAALMPLATGFDSPTVNVIQFVAVYMILAQGLNVVVGFTGLLDLGYVLFLATGAVVTAFLLRLTRLDDGTWLWEAGSQVAGEGAQLFGFDGSILIVLAIAGSVCALAGVIRGIPTLRVTGDYYAIVTLGFAEVVYLTYLWDASSLFEVAKVTGGAMSSGIQGFRPTLFGTELYWSEPVFYYLLIGFVALTVAAVWRLQRSRVGRAWAAIRLDETAAKSCGVRIGWYKVLAFAISGFIGGVGGGLYCVWNGTVSVKSLDVWQSIMVLACVVLGGLGSVRGVAVGTVLLMSLGELLREDIGGVSIPPEARFLVYGVLLIVFMRFRPQGLLPPALQIPPIDGLKRSELLARTCRLFGMGDDAERER